MKHSSWLSTGFNINSNMTEKNATHFLFSTLMFPVVNKQKQANKKYFLMVWEVLTIVTKVQITLLNFCVEVKFSKNFVSVTIRDRLIHCTKNEVFH